MTTYRIVHKTRYEFDEATASCHLEARLAARDLPGQTCRFHQLVVTPLSGKRRAWRDDFGNPVCGFTVPAALHTLEVTAINVVRCALTPAPRLGTSPPWERARPDRDSAIADEFDPFVMATPLTVCPADLAAYASASFPPGRPVLSAARDLTSRIHRDFAYSPGATRVDTTAAESAYLGRGVCQDFAHIGVACLRALGLAARYVSGYLDTAAVKGPRARVRPGGDASHAWFSVHAPDLGWIDFDPTNDSLADTAYVTLAWGRDYGDAAPLRGAAAGGGRHVLTVSVEMEREAAA